MWVGILAFVAALLLSIMLHEAGHFLTAKRFGMKVTDYFLGFGPTLWSFQRGETEYGVKAVPAGGFVKIVGMTTLEEVDPEDEPRAFYRQKAWKRAVVLGAGSAMHFLIGFVLLVAVFAGIGLVTTTTTLGTVAPCVPPTVDTISCPAGSAESPALAAGLKVGDKLVSFDGTPVDDWDQASRLIRGHGAGPVVVVVERDGRRVTTTVHLVTAQRADLDDPTKTVTVSVMGVGPQAGRERLSPVAAVTRSGGLFVDSIGATFGAIGAIPGQIPQLFQSGERSAESSPASVVGVARLSGEAVSAPGDWQGKVATFLLIVASLNIFVGIFNLLPLLPLDGGHLAVLGYEEVRGRFARARGRPDPGHVDLNKLLPATYVVVMVFVGLTLLLVLSDIINPIKNPFGG